MNDKRDKTIDIIKGFGILLVIIGHISSTPQIIKIWLYSFHMPLFFFCSGLVFSYNDFGKFIKSKLRGLVIPYFCLGSTLWLFINIRNLVLSYIGRDVVVNFNPTKMIISLLLGYRLHNYYYSLWFLCTLFISELIFFFIVRLFGKKKLVYLMLTVLSIALQHFLWRFVRGFYWSLDIVPVCIAFLSLGFFIKITKNKNVISKIYFLMPAFIGNFYFTKMNHQIVDLVDLFGCKLGNPIYYGFSAVCGIWTIMIVSNYLEASKIYEYLGKNSLVIYVYQKSLAIPIGKDVASYLKNRSILYNDKTVLWFVVIGVTLVISVVFVEIINRFFPWIIGKRKILYQK